MSKTRGGGQSQIGQQQIDENYLETIMNKVCAKFVAKIEEKLYKRFDVMEAKIDELSNKVNAIDNTVQTSRSDIEMLRNKLDEMEQQQKKNSLRFDGLKEADSEELLKIVCNILSHTMKIKCSIGDIDDVYRIGKISMQGNSRPRTVMVKFVSHLKWIEVIKARKLLKNTGVFVNEDLTRQQYRLQLMTKEKFGVRNVWTWGGKIYANYNDSVRVIKNKHDLEF